MLRGVTACKNYTNPEPDLIFLSNSPPVQTAQHPWQEKGYYRNRQSEKRSTA